MQTKSSIIDQILGKQQPMQIFTPIILTTSIIHFSPNKRHFAELALLSAIYLINKDSLKNKDERSLYRDLDRTVKHNLGYLFNASKNDVQAAVDLVFEFGKQTGWLEQKKHPGTILSFCAAMIEQSPCTFSDSIMEALNKIVAYLEERNDLKPLCCWAGSLAAEQWEKLFND